MPNCPTTQGETVQIVLNWVLGTQEVKNVVHVRVPGGFQATPTIADSVTSAFDALVTSSLLRPFLAATTRTPFASLRDIRNPNGALVEGVLDGTLGTGVSDELPKQIAAVVTLRTAKAGRSFRGRAYLPGFDEAANDPTGHIIDACKTALNNFAAGFLPVFNHDGMQLVVWNRPVIDRRPGMGCAVLRPGSIENVTTAIVRDNRWDNQRRRNK